VTGWLVAKNDEEWAAAGGMTAHRTLHKKTALHANDFFSGAVAKMVRLPGVYCTNL
jgi:hypothetical protein